jgi:SnoaL-like domain
LTIQRNRYPNKTPEKPNMTRMKIPSTVAAFVKAMNDRDSSAVVACFANGAVVYDEGQEMRGLVLIKEWSERGFEKYRCTIDPTDLREADDKTVLTATIKGNFPGSPVSLDFNFALDGEKIV